MRALKYLAAVIGVVVLALVAAIIYVHRLDPEVYKGYVVDAVHEATGREVHIDGDVRVTVLPAPAIRLDNVRLANVSWASEPDMLTLKRLDLRLALWPLLSGSVRVNRLLLVAPIVHLEVDEKGRPNWELGRKDAKTAQRGGFDLSLASATVRDGTIHYRERGTGTQAEFRVQELSAHEVPEGLAVRLRSSYREQPVRLDGTVGSVATLLANRPFPFRLEGNIGGIQVKATGAVRTKPDTRGFRLTLETTADSLDTLAQLTDVALPAVGPLRGSLELSGVPPVFEVRDLDIAAGESRMTGNLKLDLGAEPPSAKGALSAPLLDVAAFLPEAPEKVAEKKATTERLFPTDPLPLEVLSAWDLDLQLSADKVGFRKLTLEDVALPIALRAGRLTVSPQASLAGGRFTGEISVARAGTAPPTVGLRMTGRDFEFGELSRQIRGFELTRGGKSSLDINLAGRGSSVSEILAGSNGRVEFEMREAAIQTTMLDRAGGDLLGQLLEVFIPSGEKKEMTQLECVVVRFGVRDGIAVADKTLVAQTEKVNVVGGGTINLKDETLDLGARLGARQGIHIGGGALASLVRLRGPLTDPRIGTDLAGIAVAGAQVAGAVATLGGSLLIEKAYEQIVKQPDPCKVALAAELPTGKAASAAEKEKAAPPPKKPQKSLLRELLGQ